MKSKQENLFELVKALSQSEKRYFKLFASFNSNSNDDKYVKIFDIIDKQINYDEQEIKKKTRSKSFHTEKQRLYQLILKSLVLYNMSSNLDIQLKLDLCYVEVLKDKKLLNQSVYQLDKIRKTTQKYERYWLALEANRLEKIICIDSHFTGKTHVDLENMVAQDKQLTALVEISSDYWLLAQGISIYTNYSGLEREKEFHEKLEALKNSYAFKTPIDTIKGYHAKFYAISAKIVYYWLEHNYEKSIHYHQELMNLYEQFPYQKELNPLNYTRVLSNMLELKLITHNLYDFEDGLNKLKAMQTNSKISLSKELQHELYIRILDKELQFNCLIGGFEKAASLSLETIDYLRATNYIVPSYPNLMFYISFVVAFYGNTDYKEAAKLLGKIFQMEHLYKMNEMVRLCLEDAGRISLSFGKEKTRIEQRDSLNPEKNKSIIISKAYSKDSRNKENPIKYSEEVIVNGKKIKDLSNIYQNEMDKSNKKKKREKKKKKINLKFKKIKNDGGKKW